MNIFKKLATQARNLITRNQLAAALYRFMQADSPILSDDLEEYLEKGYAQNAWVGAVIDRIAVEAASIPINLIKEKADGGKEIIKTHNLIDLLKRPNSRTTKPEFVELAIKWDLICGNTYIYAPRLETGANIGQISKDLDGNYNMFLLPAHLTVIIGGSITEPIKGYKLKNTTEPVFNTLDVCHIKRANTNYGDGKELYGESPMKSLRYTIAISNNANKTQNSSFKNAGISGILSIKGGGGEAVEQAKRIKEKFKDKYEGAEHQNEVFVTGYDMGWTPMNRTTVELGVLESELQSLRKVCSNYQVSSGLFNDPQGSTYNNKREEKKALYTDAVLPALQRFLDGLNNWIVPAYQQDGTKLYFEPDIQAIPELQEDKEKLVKWLMQAWVVSPNKKLEILGLEQVDDPQADEMWVPANLIPMGLDGMADTDTDKFLRDHDINDYKLTGNVKKLERYKSTTGRIL